LGEIPCGFDSRPGHKQNLMSSVIRKKINEHFFDKWNSEMSYILGYIVADGCICEDKKRKKNPFSFNITSADREHLYKIKEALGSEYKIGDKLSSNGNIIAQMQFRNKIIVSDLMKLGITFRKTYSLGLVKVQEEYFADFVRGFFDGDGSVFIYNVNNTPQIKVGFVCASLEFITDFNQKLCCLLKIKEKSIHCIPAKENKVNKYSIDFYISDCEKLYSFMYGNNPEIYLERKRKIFEEWQNIKRRHYIKQDYPSKIGWHLNKNLAPVS
jgi:hypothetical protein